MTDISSKMARLQPKNSAAMCLLGASNADLSLMDRENQLGLGEVDNSNYLILFKELRGWVAVVPEIKRAEGK